MAVYKTIGKYEVRRQIGRGAMGVVFEAFDPTIERRVAIKTLRLEIFEESQLKDVRARFKREAQSAGQMTHPHIVTVYEYGEHEGTPYIVMEYMTGHELSKVLKQGSRLPLSEVARLMTQLLGALAYAHQQKIVHRDIKPGNIFILDDGSLKVVDFGIARVEASNLTDTGALLGTPAYMSPEQFLALPVDERSDIFSAGVILYELLTGDKPFTGSVTTIMQKVLRQEPIDPSVLNPLISNAWDAVTKRAMAKKPEARFQSARQFAETLKLVSESVQVSIEATLAGDRSNAAAIAGDARHSDARSQQEAKVQQKVPAPSEARSRPKLWALSVAAGLLMIAATWFLVAGKQSMPIADKAGAEKKAGLEQAISHQKTAENVAQEKAAAEKPALEIEKIKKETEERVRREYADKLASEQASLAKAALEKEAQDKKLAIKVASERAARENAAAVRKVALEKAAAEKAAQEKAAAESAAAEKAALEKATAEKAAQEKAAAERAAIEKAAAEKRVREPFRFLAQNSWRAGCIPDPLPVVSITKGPKHGKIMLTDGTTKVTQIVGAADRSCMGTEMPARIISYVPSGEQIETDEVSLAVAAANGSHWGFDCTILIRARKANCRIK